ncbi:UNVERIFIED_CONTAM: hypothetical protein GTU68_017875 [Idotea baltica]|nr:hypothetical protein [Idotea baltica]
MDGEIKVESEVELGTRFVITLPFTIDVTAESKTVSDLTGKRILLVDSHRKRITAIERLFQDWDVISIATTSTFDAIQEIEQATVTGVPFDIIIASWNISDKHAGNLATTLEKVPKEATHFIVLHPPYRLPKESSWCSHLNTSATITTPVRPKELAKVLRNLFDGPAPEQEEAKATENSPPPLQALHVLLAEDSVVNQKLAVALLKKDGHSVVVAENGVEAVEKFSNEQFDAILMDIQMPEMDGFEATAEIRKLENESHIPIIALTAHAMVGYRERCLQAGMDGYITKPLRVEEMFEEIAKAIQKSTNAQ